MGSIMRVVSVMSILIAIFIFKYIVYVVKRKEHPYCCLYLPSGNNNLLVGVGAQFSYGVVVLLNFRPFGVYVGLNVLQFIWF